MKAPEFFIVRVKSPEDLGQIVEDGKQHSFPFKIHILPEMTS